MDFASSGYEQNELAPVIFSPFPRKKTVSTREGERANILDPSVSAFFLTEHPVRI
jgi:hypothetical protein